MRTRPREGGRILAEAGPTISIPDAAKVLGISRGHAYALARAEGALAGVRVLHLGSRMVLPTIGLRRAVGQEAPTEPKGAA